MYQYRVVLGGGGAKPRGMPFFFGGGGEVLVLFIFLFCHFLSLFLEVLFLLFGSFFVGRVCLFQNRFFTQLAGTPNETFSTTQTLPRSSENSSRSSRKHLQQPSI